MSCFKVNSERSPYVDDDGQSCIQISIVNSNYICGASEVAMTVDDVAAIAFYHNNISKETKRDYEIREQIWYVPFFIFKIYSYTVL